MANTLSQASIFFCTVFLMAAGCAPIGIEATDLSELSIGMSETRVKQLIGPSFYETPSASGTTTIKHYEIDLGHSVADLGFSSSGSSGAEVLMLPVLFPALVIGYVASEAEAEAARPMQRGVLQVYFENERVAWAGKFSPDGRPGSDKAEASWTAKVMNDVAAAYSAWKTRAGSSGEAAYTLALYAEPSAIRDYWWCRSAEEGYPKGVNAVALHHINCL